MAGQCQISYNPQSSPLSENLRMSPSPVTGTPAVMVTTSFRRPANLLFTSTRTARPCRSKQSLRLDTLWGNCMRRPRPLTHESSVGYTIHYFTLFLYKETEENSPLVLVPGLTVLNCSSLTDTNYDSSFWIICSELKLNMCPTSRKCAKV